MDDSALLRTLIGDRAAALLADEGLCAAELAARTGLSTGRVERLLAGTLSDLTLRDVGLVAEAFDIPAYHLLVSGVAPSPTMPLKIVEQRGPRDA